MAVQLVHIQRRSHFKSRKGCTKCKSRHIRCDEIYPQCLNCTKHNVRCPYNDAPVIQTRPKLEWTPRVEGDLQHWCRTGHFPVPNLRAALVPNTQDYDETGLQLIVYAGTLYDDMDRQNTIHFTMWISRLASILRIGATERYVMDALLSFLALSIYQETGVSTLNKAACEYRGSALRGLFKALSSFSRHNSDAVLAASLALFWQASDCRDWEFFRSGTAEIVRSMELWKDESEFNDLISEMSSHRVYQEPAPDASKSKSKASHKAHQKSLQRILDQLTELQCGSNDTRYSNPIQTLRIYLENFQKTKATESLVEKSHRIMPMKRWLFWLPLSLLREDYISSIDLVVIGYHYAAAVKIEQLSPHVIAGTFANLLVEPITAIVRHLVALGVAANLENSESLPPAALGPLHEILDQCTVEGGIRE